MLMTSVLFKKNLVWLFFTTLCIHTVTVFSAFGSQHLRHGISFYGTPKYGPDFTHFDYVNPKAPKGGTLKQGVIGHFDTFVPYIDRGTAAAGSHRMYDSLLARSWDEPLTKYGLIADSIELDPYHFWVAFTINPKAYFHDGQPVTARDVEFSFDLLRKKGSAFYRHFYREIDRVDVTDSHRVVFHFSTNKNRELPLILGQMPILAKHYWKDRDFASPGLEIPLSSGPYRPVNAAPGKSITYERVKNYWGANIPANKGRHNFDQIQYEYYRTKSVLLEALQKGHFDFQVITDPRTWHDQIKDSALERHHLTRTTLVNHNPQTLTLTYNTRKAALKDVRVRQAIGYAVNFERLNQHLFHGMYTRASSYFAGTEMAADNLPSAEELTLLTPWRASLPEALFNESWSAPGGEKNVSSRDRKIKALNLLKASGWKVKNNQQVNSKGQPLILEALLSNPEQERILIPIQKALANFGIRLKLRTVDTAQFLERLRNQDFDVVLHTFYHTASPGTEQANFWASATVNQHGTRNITGANLPVLDDLTQRIPAARSRTELVNTVRALDRVLLWQHYALPLWYQPYWAVIHKKTLRHPEHPAPYALDFSTWWRASD